MSVTNYTFAGNGIDPGSGTPIAVGTAIDIVGGSVSISANTFKGHSPLTDADVVGPFTLIEP
jgi:hypothetical protein